MGVGPSVRQAADVDARVPSRQAMLRVQPVPAPSPDETRDAPGDCIFPFPLFPPNRVLR